MTKITKSKASLAGPAQPLRTPIVSSAHLAEGKSAEMSEFGFGRIIAGIAFILNIEDTHVVNYALKKLQNLCLVQTEKRGKEVLYSTNEKGQAVCKRYFEVREQVLVSNLTGSGTESFELAELARFLRMLSGLYDQASRAATSL